MIDFNHILQHGITISSSGTSGSPKEYFQPPEKLLAANKVAIEAQKISKNSKIYTCCKTSHAGGLLAQTLPAFSIGAQVDIELFNPYEFVRKINNYTHTHITPLHAKAIMLTKGWRDLDLSGLWVTCGADPVTWDLIESFVSKGATFMTNWGMSEVGPIAINSVFDNVDKVRYYRDKSPKDATILGETFWCQYKVDNGELGIKGPICVYNDWYMTKDKVVVEDGIMYYLGRTNKDVDLWTPRKG